MSEMSNDEIRMSKECRMTKPAGRVLTRQYAVHNDWAEPPSAHMPLRQCDFGLPSSFELRHSTFSPQRAQKSRAVI
jgi:hypothetical protein